jgi:hypothetical protein
MFHLFHMYVASVSFGCRKTRSGCCIYMQVFKVLLYVCWKCFILMFAYVCNGYTHVFKFFGVLQVFQTYVASVSAVSDVCCSVLFECCKSRSSIAHVAMRVRRGEGASGPCALSSGAGPVWAREMQARTGTCRPEHGKRSAARASVRTSDC